MKRSFQDEFLKAVAAKNLTNNVGVGEDSQNNTNFTCKNKKPRGRKRKQSFNTIADEEDDWYELHSQRKKKTSSRSSNKAESTAVITAICEDAEEPNPATDDPLADYDQDITSTIIKDEDLIEQIEDENIKTEYIIHDLETSHRSSPEITNVLINISQCIVSTTRLNDMAVLNMESKLTPQEIFAAIDIESRPTIIKACDFLEQRNSLDFNELQERIGELNHGIQNNTTKTPESSLLVQPNFNVGPCKTSNEVPKHRGVTGSSDVSTSALWQHVETKEEYIDESNTKQTGARHYTKLKKKLQVLLIDFRKYAVSSKSLNPIYDIQRITSSIQQNYLRKTILDELQTGLDPDQVVLFSSNPNTAEFFQYDSDISNTYCIKKINLPSLCSESTLRFLAQHLKCFAKYVCCWSNRNSLLKKESVLKSVPLDLVQKQHACSDTCGCCENCRPTSTVKDYVISPSIEDCTLRDLLNKRHKEVHNPPSKPLTLIDRALMFTKRSQIKKSILTKANSIIHTAETKIKALTKKSTDHVIEFYHRPTSYTKVERYETLNVNGIETYTMVERRIESNLQKDETLTNNCTVFNNICCWNKRQKILYDLKASHETQEIVKLIKTKHTCPFKWCVCCCPRAVKSNLCTDTTSSKVSPPKIDSNKAPAKKTTKTPPPCGRKQVIVNARKEMTTNDKNNVANVIKNFNGLRLAIDKDKKVQALLSNVKNIAALSTTALSQLKALLEQAQVIADRYNIESGTQLAHILGMHVSPVHTLPSNIPVTAACVKKPALDMPVITTAPSLPNPVPLQPKPNYCIIKMKPIPTDVTQKQAVYVTNTTPKCQPTHFDGAVNLLAKATVSDTTVIKTMPIITSVTSLGSGNSSAVLIPNNLTPSVTKTSKDLTPAVIRVRKEICKSQTITEPVASTSAGLWYKTPDNKPITDDINDATESVVYNVNSEEYQRNLLDAETGEEVKTNFDDDWDLATLKKNIISDMIDIKEDQISEYGSDINKIDHQ
ncbi:uncharacterized protein LOC119691718 [Plutella xylostella]|uniref:uncharacterized protein LOC119691718 n=1 Tax=Plutella xylostella TaxID=51655 RepID=UPI0020321E57|nr:uncharacterized protein LOC119691718 [Plutella xylostella]